MGVENAHLIAARCGELMELANRLGDDEFRGWSVFFSLLSSAQLDNIARYDQLLVEFARLVEQLHQPMWRTQLLYSGMFAPTWPANSTWRSSCWRRRASSTRHSGGASRASTRSACSSSAESRVAWMAW
jgi:hypothetical protein